MDKNEKICRSIGFTQNVIGMEFHGKNGIYRIIKIIKRNYKYPVISVDGRGTEWKYTVEEIKELIGGDKIINRNANLDKLV